MAGVDETKPVLELDAEHREEWTVTATFFTGAIPTDEMRRMIYRDPVALAGGQILVTMHDRNQGTTQFITNQRVEGTQRTALEIMAGRYKSILGELAIADRVMGAGMNPGSVADALAGMVLAKYGLEDLDDLDEDDELPEGWEQIGEEGDGPALDVTAHLKDMLRP